MGGHDDEIGAAGLSMVHLKTSSAAADFNRVSMVALTDQGLEHLKKGVLV
jgi:hypothetical protein